MTPDQVHEAARTVTPRQRGPRSAPAHDHDLRLVQVVYEEGRQTAEFECAECGGTWYS